jgi:hypothetical protein
VKCKSWKDFKASRCDTKAPIAYMGIDCQLGWEFFFIEQLKKKHFVIECHLVKWYNLGSISIPRKLFLFTLIQLTFEPLFEYLEEKKYQFWAFCNQSRLEFRFHTVGSKCPQLNTQINHGQNIITAPNFFDANFEIGAKL